MLTAQAMVSPAYAAPPTIHDIQTIFQNIIGLLAPATAVAFLIMLIVGGFKFLTSGGDPKAVGSARSTMTYAILGVILVVASWLILVLVKEITGYDVTTFKLPF